MTTKELNRRNRYKWSVNEILSLQREYELQELTIQEIAILHKRSDFSILHKLEKEQIINNFNEARGYEQLNFWDESYQEDDENEDEYEENEYEENENEENEDDENENKEDNEINLSLQKPTSYDDDDSDDNIENLENHDENYHNDIEYFEDALIKKIEENSNSNVFITEPLQHINNTTNNLKNICDNKELFYIVYKLIGRIEILEKKISEIENVKSNSFVTFIKNWFCKKRLC
jgi:hypothetical protein